MTELTELSIREAGELMRRRKIAVPELVDATLDRINSTEPVVHAFASVLAESAQREADQAEKELASGVWRGPLHGIPLGVKDLCYTKGIATRAGSEVLGDFKPAFDSTVVQRLRQAGAIIVGKTITHEFALGQNQVPTRNPWDDGYYPGGSSAGSGVATAVCSIFGGIGTDTAGSIRAPCSINGIVGLKPTYGRVSKYGVVAASPSLDHVGPMARSVEDCALLLQAIAGHDPMDRASGQWEVPDFCADLRLGVAKMRLGIDVDYFFSKDVHPQVKSAVESACKQLESEGAAIVELQVPTLEHMVATGLTILQVEASAVHRRFLRACSDKYDRETRLLLQAGELIPGAHYVAAQQARTLLRDAVKRVFQAFQLDALVAPTLPVATVPLARLSTSLRTDGPSSLSGFVRHCIPANVTGQPAITVPCGLTSGGLPIGLQLIGKPLQELSLLRIAQSYEASCTWSALRPPVVGHGGTSGDMAVEPFPALQ